MREFLVGKTRLPKPAMVFNLGIIPISSSVEAPRNFTQDANNKENHS